MRRRLKNKSRPPIPFNSKETELQDQPKISQNVKIQDSTKTKPVSQYLPGDIVQFNGLKNEKFLHLNDKLGIIKKHHDGDRYRIMLHSQADEVAVSSEKFKLIKNCPREKHSVYSPVMVWTAVCRVNITSIQSLKIFPDLNSELEKLSGIIFDDLRDQLIAAYKKGAVKKGDCRMKAIDNRTGKIVYIPMKEIDMMQVLATQGPDGFAPGSHPKVNVDKNVQELFNKPDTKKVFDKVKNLLQIESSDPADEGTYSATVK